MERLSLLWSPVRERAMAKGFSSNMGDTKYPCVCRRTKLPGWGVHGEKLGQGYRQEISERRSCDRI